MNNEQSLIVTVDRMIARTDKCACLLALLDSNNVFHVVLLLQERVFWKVGKVAGRRPWLPITIGLAVTCTVGLGILKLERKDGDIYHIASTQGY